MDLLGLAAFGIIGWIIGLLVFIIVFFIIRELWFGGIKKELLDLYNKNIDLENKLSKIENSLRMLVRMEKCRMIEEGFIDGETNRFKNWNINKDFKPSKVVPITEQQTENVLKESVSENNEENMSDKDNIINENVLKKESKNIFQKIFGVFKKKK